MTHTDFVWATAAPSHLSTIRYNDKDGARAMGVDGLDVVDGQAASAKKRGYIVNPRQTLVVKGFRTSHEAVASFKFSSVSRAYANLRHGETRSCRDHPRTRQLLWI